MHEIITLQLGQRANYLATHFWNTQESYFTYSPGQESLVDHDVHFRPGIGVDGTQTFTPRTLIYDHKGGFGSMRKVNALYDKSVSPASQALWHGSTIVHEQPAVNQHPYQHSLDENTTPLQLTSDSIRYWSDFNRVYYHPRSLIQLNEYELNSALTPFQTWSAGEELFRAMDKVLDVLDTDLRRFTEEADQMQGFNIISSVDDGWAGFAAGYLDRLKDEFGKTTTCFWGVEENTQASKREKRLPKLLNSARSIAEISSQASIYIPMSLPKTLPHRLNLRSSSSWQVCGLFATAFESVTLPFRLKYAGGVLETSSRTAALLSANGNQNIARLQISVGVGQGDATGLAPSKISAVDKAKQIETSEHNLEDGLDIVGTDELSPIDIDFLPQSIDGPVRVRRQHPAGHIFGRFECNRYPAVDSMRSVDIDEGHAHDRVGGTKRRLEVGLPFALLDSFPKIYTGASGSVAVRASLETNSAIAVYIKALDGTISGAAPLEERETLRNTLMELAESYQQGWESDSDGNDD